MSVSSEEQFPTATMDQDERLAMVQEMVQDMKLSFSTAMEELANIQFGDQNIQQQMIDDRADNQQQFKDISAAVQSIKEQMEGLAGQMKAVMDNQKKLEERLDNVQPFDKETFLEELHSMGLLVNEKKQTDNTSAKDVSSLVHPYLASLPQKGVDDDTQSVTALACKSLNLSQALHEKCLHLEISPSSDDEDTIRHPQTSGIPMLNREPMSHHLLDGKLHFSPKKVPPHEKFLEEVQREKSVQETLAAEKAYCAQLWNLIESYMRPLQQGELMSQHDLNSVFPAYIPQLYEQHCILLRKMEERMMKWKYSGMVGDVLIKLTDSHEAEGLTLYKDYISDFPAIINNINCWFSESSRFRDIMRSTSLASSSIIPLLLAPLQQIPKYSLLIKNMLKHTSDDHPDRYYLETALTRLKQFLTIMNSDLEHAMQFLNISKTPITRSRDYGNSTRSRSSGSSCEANQASSARDSGIHSNGEENVLRQPASPNTTRRYVLQVLRDRREREAAENIQETRPTPLPMRSHAFGSHPDLSHSELSTRPGTCELPSYMPYANGSKMYSSLTKIPTRDPPKSPEKPPRKIKIRRRQEGQKTPLNSNYLRPLTPHLPFNNSPRSDVGYSENDSRRPRSVERRPRSARPASSIDFSGGDIERRERLLEQFSLQSSEISLPRGHPREGRAKSELHLSLQRLLAERERSDAMENERYEQHGNYFRPLDASSVHESDHYRQEERAYHQDYGNYEPQSVHSARDNYRNFTGSVQPEEDYGIFGVDEDESYSQEVHNSQTPRNFPEHVMNSSRRSSRRRNISNQEKLAYQIAQSMKEPNSRPDGSEDDRSASGMDAKSSHSNALGNSSSTDSGPPDHSESPVSLQDKVHTDDSSSAEFTKISVERPREIPPRDHANSGASKIDLQNDEIIPKMSKMNSLDRSRKYELWTDKSSDDTLADIDSLTASNTDINRNTVKMRNADKPDPGKRKSLPIVQHYKKDGAISPISSIPSNVSPEETNNMAVPRARLAVGERTPKKLPVLQGRHSVPIPDPSSGSKASSPPVSPTSPNRPGAKDTKIPLYTPTRTKKERAPRPQSTTPMSKSTEDVSKLKKKTAFKQSIKNFFGRKRAGTAGADELANEELEEGQV